MYCKKPRLASGSRSSSRSLADVEDSDATYLGVMFKELEQLRNPHLPDDEIEKLLPKDEDDKKKATNSATKPPIDPIPEDETKE